MKVFLLALGCAALWPTAVALAQQPHSQHSLPKKEAPAKVEPVATGKTGLEGYRTFNPDEPRKDWRTANEEVRAAGGHMGILKSKGSAGDSHAGHGASSAGKKP